MFRWLVNKEIRGDLDEMHSKIKRLHADVEALTRRMNSLQGSLNRAGGRAKKDTAEGDEGGNDVESLLAGLTPQEKAHVMNSIEWKSLIAQRAG